MPKFDITVSARVPAYVVVDVEADNLKAAQEAATRIMIQGWASPELSSLTGGDWEPEWDALTDFEIYAVQPAEEPKAA